MNKFAMICANEGGFICSFKLSHRIEFWKIAFFWSFFFSMLLRYREFFRFLPGSFCRSNRIKCYHRIFDASSWGNAKSGGWVRTPVLGQYINELFSLSLFPCRSVVTTECWGALYYQGASNSQPIWKLSEDFMRFWDKTSNLFSDFFSNFSQNRLGSNNVD